MQWMSAKQLFLRHAWTLKRALKRKLSWAIYEPLGRTFVRAQSAPKHEHYIAVVTAGTSDIHCRRSGCHCWAHSEITLNVFTTLELLVFTASSIVSKTSGASVVIVIARGRCFVQRRWRFIRFCVAIPTMDYGTIFKGDDFTQHADFLHAALPSMIYR